MLVDNLLEGSIKFLAGKFCGKATAPLVVKELKTAIRHRSNAAMIQNGIMTFFELGAIGDAITVGLVWKMYLDINKSLGIKFSKNVMKTIGSGVVANLATFVAVSALVSEIPVYAQTAGVVVNALINKAIIIISAYIYLEAIKSLVAISGTNFTSSQAEQSINNYMANNKGTIKKMFKELTKK